MKKSCYLFLFTILFGCAGSPTRTAFEAEKHRMDMMDIKTNMSMEEVRDRMGVPKKIERRAMNGIEYEIWYYMTMGVFFEQTRLIDENYTPFVFYGTCLRGWGWKFYNHLFDINNARFKREEDRKGGCSGKVDYNHKIITPYKGEEKKGVEESLENLIKSAKEEEPKKAAVPPTVNNPATQPPPSIQQQVTPKIDNIESAEKKLPGESLEVIQKPIQGTGTTPTIIHDTPVAAPPKVGNQPSGSTTNPSPTPSSSTPNSIPNNTPTTVPSINQ